MPRVALRILTPNTLPDGVVGTDYATITPTTQGVRGTPQWSQTGMPPGVDIDQDTGIISGRPTTAGTYSAIVVTLADGFSTTSRGYSATVSSTTALAITTSSMPAARIGSSYSAAMAAANGTSPYTWSATSDGVALPTGGLAIDPSSGQITGTPTGAAGTRSIVVTVSDSLSVTASRTFSLVVGERLLAITTTSLPAAVNGTAYSKTITKVGGAGPYTWSVSGQPDPLAINSSGVLSGTPSDTAGTYHVTVTVNSGDGQTDSATLDMALTGGVSSPPAFAGHMLGLVLPPAAGFNTAHLNQLIAAQPDLTIIRNQLDWSGAQPSRTADPDFTSAVRSMQTFRSRLNSGPDSLILVMSPPAWARPPGSGQHAYPTDPDDFGYFCGKAAEYVKAQKPTMRQRWEIFNEPNNAFFTDGVDPVSPAQIRLYARCLQAAYKAIKAVAPNALVSTGGTAPSPVDARKGHNWLPLVLDAMKAEHTAGNYTKPAAGWHAWCACDRISHHPYATGRLTNGVVVDSSNNLPSNAFGHDTPLMAQAVVAKVGVQMIFWQTEAGIKNHHNATTGQGWIGGPYTKPHPNIAGKTQNWDINSGPEAYDVLNLALDQWFGRVNWPGGDKLAVWPDGNTKKATRTELYCYFHMGHDIFTGDFAVSIDGIWDYNDVVKRVAGTNNDLYEAFTQYVVP